ncbi:MAG: NAD(P)H-hydrate epimerase [Gemmatimonadota bacterium]
MLASRPANALPCLTPAQMREVDRAMVEDYGITLLQMMEQAGRHLAHVARARFLDGDPRGRPVAILCGTGGNGGGGLVAARRLHAWGARVHVFTTRRDERFSGVPALQLSILRRLEVGVTAPERAVERESPLRGESIDGRAEPLRGDRAPVALSSCDLILDALIGYGLAGSPRGAAARLIELANAQGAPILSLDVPSGLDAGSGRVREPTIRAAATLTLALPKTGVREPAAAGHVGELYLADIGVPPQLYTRPGLGLRVGAIFAREEVLRLSE